MNNIQNNNTQNNNVQGNTQNNNIDLQNVKEFGSIESKSNKGNIHCLTIIGQIEGHIVLPPQNKTTKYEHVVPQLVAIEQNDQIDGLLVVLNTVGGDVEAGLALAEMISGMKKPTVSLILGGGHSIGVPLAVSAKYSLISSSATMTIHPIRLMGPVIGVTQTFEYFNRMQDRVVEFVTANSEITRQEFRKLMFNSGQLANDVGSILFGEEAVKSKLINAVGGISDAFNILYKEIEKNRAKNNKEEGN